jgi:dUTP pyrophosphatase
MMKVRLHRPEAKAPTVAHPGEDLGYDVYAAEAVTLPARGGAIVPTGISVELSSEQDGRPMGALIRDRSSMAVKHIITTAGVIDAGYRGEIRIVMENLSDTPFEIHAGDKIANMVPCPVLTSKVEVVDELAESSRATGGFGSTGKK